MKLASLMLNIVSIWVVAITVILSALYIFLKSQYNYWLKRGIVGPKPAFFFGSLKDAIFLKCTEAEALKSISDKYADEKYIGMFHLWKPVLLIKDLDLVKRITEKDFEHFTDHPDIIGVEKTDSVLESLFQMKGNIWKSRRTYFSKLFTPRKLKDYAEEMQLGLDELMKQMDDVAQKGKDIEMFSAMEPFAIYSIASAMYGLNVLHDDVRSNILKRLTHFFMHPPADSVIKFICYGIYPKLFRFLRLKTLPTWHWESSSKLADELTYTREYSGADRNDCLGMVMKLKEQGTNDIKKISYEESVGHLYSFLQAGTHTTQTTTSHVLGRLAEYPDVQEKLRKEVDSILKGSKEITYDDVKKMTYMDNVILETQRIRPLLGILKRTCTKPYKIDERLTIPKQMDVYIDVTTIQTDPKYFPEPEKFLPERWTNGQSEQSAFMAFGRGPRICIGKRFAEVEMKMAIAAIVSRYVVLPSEAMKPMKFDPQTLFITNIPLDGIWVKLKKRESSE